MSKSEQPYYAFLRQLKASHGYDCSNRFGEIKQACIFTSNINPLVMSKYFD